MQEHIGSAGQVAGRIVAAAIDDNDLSRLVLAQQGERVAQATFLIQSRYDNRDANDKVLVYDHEWV